MFSRKLEPDERLGNKSFIVFDLLQQNGDLDKFKSQIGFQYAPKIGAPKTSDPQELDRILDDNKDGITFINDRMTSIRV